MLTKFDEQAQKAIVVGESIAFDLGHNNVGSEHLLLSLLKISNSKLKELVKKYNVDDKNIYEDIKRLDECINMKQLKINGSSLKEMGVKDGKLIGEILKAALDEAQKDNENNKKEVLEKFVRERFLL